MEAGDAGAIPGAVDPGGPDDGEREVVLAMHVPEILLGLDFGAGVIAPAMDIYAQGGGFVEGKVFGIGVAVGTDAGDMEKAADADLVGGLSEVPGGLDSVALEFVPRPPVAYTGGGMEDGLDVFAGLTEAVGVGQVRDDLFHRQGVKESRVG